MKYFMRGNKRFTVTKHFFNLDGNQNVIDCNSYLKTKNMEEGVIWASDDRVLIIVCRMDDKGQIIDWDNADTKHRIINNENYKEFFECTFQID